MESTMRRAQTQLQGPRPPPLVVSRSSSNIKKGAAAQPARQRRGPVIIYVKSPDTIHVRPEEFMGLVQRLTGKQPSPPPASSCAMVDCDGGAGDHSNDNTMKADIIRSLDEDGRQKLIDIDNGVAAYPGFCVSISADWQHDFE